MQKAKEELSFASKFDFILENNNLHDAFEKADRIVTDFLTQ